MQKCLEMETELSRGKAPWKHYFLALNYNICFFSQVVFSDESTILGLDDRLETVRRHASEDFLPECLKKTRTFPQKIMVWGAISIPETSPFVYWGAPMALKFHRKFMGWVKRRDWQKTNYKKTQLIARLIKVWYHCENIKALCKSLVLGMPSGV